MPALTRLNIAINTVKLEQYDQTGGSCHVFTEKGFEFDVGIHYVGDMNEGTWSIRQWGSKPSSLLDPPPPVSLSKRRRV